MFKQKMRRTLLNYCIAIATLANVNAQTVQNERQSGDEFIKSLKGTYVELFSPNTCLNPKYDNLWKSETQKHVEASKSDSIIAVIQGGCLSKTTGMEAIAYNQQNSSMQFCCAFLQGVNRFEIKGNRISGYGVDNKLVFSHQYKFKEMDGNGNYIFESADYNRDEFRYFWFMPDSPKSTFHIEFRYGSDKAQLSLMTEGKYAFWMAAGVREHHEDEWRKSIVLFVNERLKETH